MKTRTQKIVMSAMFASLACVATMIIKIPSPLGGYINLGDCIVLLAGMCLSPLYAFFAAGIGSFLADVFAGYSLYAPVTLLIKGVMAVVAFCGARAAREKKNKNFTLISFCVLAEFIMVAGYYVFEGFLYGFAESLVNIAPNAVQGTVGVILGVIVFHVFEKNKVIMK